jgi:hypothetical protein
MPDNIRFDPFHPQQPRIPGVPEGKAKAKPAPPPPEPQAAATEPMPSRRPLPWIPMIVAGVLIATAGFFWWKRVSSSDPDRMESTGSAVSSPRAADDPAQEKGLPVGPGKVATRDELTKAWSDKRFLFRNSLTQETVPAMVVSLPGGAYWAFSLREPFSNCDLEDVTDLAKLQSEYQFQADHPMVVDPCSRSIFDLARYGTTPSGSLVRGEIEKGGAIRPPIAIEVSVEGDEVRAIRMD